MTMYEVNQTEKNQWAQSLYNDIARLQSQITTSREKLKEIEEEAMNLLSSGPALIERTNRKGDVVPSLMFVDDRRSRRLDKFEVAAKAKVDPGEINPLGISKLSTKGMLTPDMISESYVTSVKPALRYRKAGTRAVNEYGHDQPSFDDMDVVAKEVGETTKKTSDDVADSIDAWLNE